MNYYYEQRIGGAEVQAWLLAKQLVKSGNKVYYIAENLENSSTQIDIVDGVEIHWIPYRRHFDVLNTFTYYAKLNSISPDIIVQRYTSLYTGVIGLYAKLRGIPYVWVCTDPTIPFKTYFQDHQRDALKQVPKGPLVASILKINARIRATCRNYGMKYVTHACVQNKKQHNLLWEQFGLYGHQLHSGHEKANLGDSDRSSGPELVIWAATLSKRKWPERFIELARLCSDLNAQFVLVGTHPNPDRIKCLISSTSAIPNFVWKGALSFNDTISLFDKASILVNTSDHEGFPNTFIQAWLRGIPVITFGVDPDGVINKNKLGRVASSVEDASLAIKNYLSSDYLSERERIRQYANTYHSIESVEKRFWEILSKCENQLY